MTTRWLKFCQLTQTPTEKPHTGHWMQDHQQTLVSPSVLNHHHIYVLPSKDLCIFLPSFLSSTQDTQAHCSPLSNRGIQGFNNLQLDQTSHQDTPPTTWPHTAPHHHLKPVHQHHKWHSPRSIQHSWEFWQSLSVHQYTKERSMPYHQTTPTS